MTTTTNRYWRNALVLLALSILLQCSALLGFFSLPDGSIARRIFGTLEMLLVLALLANGFAIRRWLQGVTQGKLLTQVATLCVVSLLLCVFGDLLNRNYFSVLYAYDDIIEHSYLADSVWFFFPGYGLFVFACFLSVRSRLSSKVIVSTAILAAVIGLLSFVDMRKDGTSNYITLMTGSYAMLISLMAAAAIWLLLEVVLLLPSWGKSLLIH